MSRRTRFGAALPNHRDVDRLAEIIVGRADKAAGDWNCVADVAGDGYAYQIGIGTGLLSQGATISLAVFPVLLLVVIVQLLYIRRVETH